MSLNCLTVCEYLDSVEECWCLVFFDAFRLAHRFFRRESWRGEKIARHKMIVRLKSGDVN